MDTKPTMTAAAAEKLQDLRDMFASQCIVGVLQSISSETNLINLATTAYRMADAMLAVRAKKKEPN